MNYPERKLGVTPNAWLKVSMPNRKIRGVMLHCTRSGVSHGDDGLRTEQWAANHSNVQSVDSWNRWGSFQDVIICEDGTRILCTQWDSESPTYGAGYGSDGTWNASEHYLQVEIGQGKTDDPFYEAQIESVAEFCADMGERYGFDPLHRIPFLDQTGVPPQGICTHEDSANGRKYGKSDPGYMFNWDRFFGYVRAFQFTPPEDDMQFTEGEVAALRGIIEWREAVVPVIDDAIAQIELLATGEILDDSEVAAIRDRLAAISAAAGGN